MFAGMPEKSRHKQWTYRDDDETDDDLCPMKFTSIVIGKNTSDKKTECQDESIERNGGSL